MVRNTRHMREIMNRKKMPEIEKEEEVEKMKRGVREKREGCCREAATGLLCGAWRRLIIQLIMIRLFPAGTAALEMESLCSHTPQWKRWGMAPCRWDMCTHTYTCIQTHTHKQQRTCGLINTTCTHCAYSHTYTLVYRAPSTHKHTHMLSLFTPHFSLNACCQPSSHKHTPFSSHPCS